MRQSLDESDMTWKMVKWLKAMNEMKRDDDKWLMNDINGVWYKAFRFVCFSIILI